MEEVFNRYRHLIIKRTSNLWKRLFAGTVPANKNEFAGTVPANKNKFAGTVPANKNEFAGTHPASKSNFSSEKELKKWVSDKSGKWYINL